MNKKLINSKIADLETELQKLKELANEPWPEPRRTPEAGDVWSWTDHYTYLVDSTDTLVQLNDGYCCSTLSAENECDQEAGTFLGKFDEVFVRRDEHVKISDVREAFSLTWGHCGCAAQPNYNKLMDLNIITD